MHTDARVDDPGADDYARKKGRNDRRMLSREKMKKFEIKNRVRSAARLLHV